MKFEIKDRDAGGRTGRIKTKHGTVVTPNLMPVINPNRMLITPKDMKKRFGTEIVITNSYIIKENSELRKRAIKKGVHRLIDFDGVVMTDSGTFQSYVYGDVKTDPLEIIEFQKEIGSDIGTILDVFGKPDQSKKQAENGVKETLKRAEKSVKIKDDMNIACTVQGSVYPDLRKRCAKQLSKLNTDFFPIGGVVPLMEGQRYRDLVKVIISSKKGLDPSKPVHLFGAGHPLILPLAVALGCDFFDSSAYAKYANDDRMMFPWGTEKLSDLHEIPCCCPTCLKYDISELKKMEKHDRILHLACHNLYVSFQEIKKIRNAIRQGSLWELVENKASCNPYLKEAMQELRKEDNKKWLEKFEPTSKKKALFYTGNQTIHRPLIYRYHKRILNRYNSSYNKIIVFSEGEKPYSKYYYKEIQEILQENKDIGIVVKSNLGPVPIELDEMYPIAQSVFPETLSYENKKVLDKIFKEFTNDKKVVKWNTKKNDNSIYEKSEIDFDLDLARVGAVADMQFGKNASTALFKNKEIEFVKSKKTAKIRNIYCDKKHVLSLRASDGLFTLKIEGAKLLHSFFKHPKLRVTISLDAVPFVKDGKSVFAKFVKQCDPDLRPLDECLIVDQKDNLIGVGRILLNSEEMLSFNNGVAAKTREHT